MMRRLINVDPQEGQVKLHVERQVIAAPEGISVAEALLLAGVGIFRKCPVSRQPRGPYCMMGTCFECLVTVDGVADRQSCLVQVRDGMKIDLQIPATDRKPS